MSDIAAALARMTTILGTTDEFGVTVKVDARGDYAEVTLDIPAALPDRSREILQGVAEQRVLFTRADSVQAKSLTADWDPNRFMDAVERAASVARHAVTDAAFAHARGQEWSRI